MVLALLCCSDFRIIVVAGSSVAEWPTFLAGRMARCVTKVIFHDHVVCDDKTWIDSAVLTKVRPVQKSSPNGTLSFALAHALTLACVSVIFTAIERVMPSD